jgi:predicted nucleotidyltransferase
MNHSVFYRGAGAGVGQVAEAMRERVVAELLALERRERVRVLFACESGSRAWGFASPDSDYDVRFVYVREPEWYLSIEPRRNVIEAQLPGDLDLAGWDLRKALGLLRKSNPSLLEWLHSPQVYLAHPRFLREFRKLAESCYQPARVYAHYLHMAAGNWRAYLQSAVVSRKKYLYVLRPILACRWIQLGFGPPPMEFSELRRRVLADQPEVGAAVDRLLEAKMRGGELARGPRDTVLHAFLARELVEMERLLPPKAGGLPEVERFDAFFLRQLVRAQAPECAG